MKRPLFSTTLFSFIITIFTCSLILAGEVPHKFEASGSYFSAAIDVNEDGIPGVVGQLEGKSNFGPFSVHNFGDMDILSAAESENCPEFWVEVPTAGSVTLHRYHNGDLLSTVTTEHLFCADPATGAFFWTETLDITGGTGRFEGAAGELEVYGEGTGLISDPTGLTSFGTMLVKGKGKIALDK